MPGGASRVICAERPDQPRRQRRAVKLAAPRGHSSWRKLESGARGRRRVGSPPSRALDADDPISSLADGRAPFEGGGREAGPKERDQTSASSPSAGPAFSRMRSAMRPAFSRIERSIRSAISGLAFEMGLGVLAALAEADAVEGEPGAGLLDDAGLDAEVDQFARLGDAFAVHDVELDLLERRSDLVLDHLDPRLVADDLVAVLDRADAADVEPDGGVELQRVAARRRLGRTVHDADLHPDLVDEDDHGVGARDRCGELAQRLAHQPRLQPRLGFAHLALDFGPRRQRRDRDR